MINKILGFIFMINTTILIITFSIAFIILFRPYYYVHINYLNLVDKTGYTYQEIKDAYDDVLDYAVLNKSFSTGTLKYSDEGKNHFEDCKKLFILDFILLGITTIIFIIKKIFFNNIKLFKHSIEFISSIFIIISFSLLFLLILIFGFNKSFEVFHTIFFFGKSNWLFNPRYDEIINILPQEYFMNCGILFVLLVFIISIIIIILELLKNKKKKTCL